ncbi:MAG: ribosome maturation factor RimM [Thermoleophilia bacterium]
MSRPARQVVVGRILRAHGVHGALRVRASGEVLGHLRAGDPVAVRLDDHRREMRVATPLHGELLHLEGVDDRDAAEALRGGLLEVDEERLPPAAADEFYVRDLIGCRVWLGPREAGVVEQVLTRPANDVLEVRGDGGGETVLLPFTLDAVVAVDLTQRVIRLRGDLLGDEES